MPTNGNGEEQPLQIRIHPRPDPSMPMEVDLRTAPAAPVMHTQPQYSVEDLQELLSGQPKLWRQPYVPAPGAGPPAVEPIATPGAGPAKGPKATEPGESPQWTWLRDRLARPTEAQLKQPRAGLPDPQEEVVNWVSRNLPEGTPDWLRTAGRVLIPQNLMELGAEAAGGVPLRYGKLAGKGVFPFLGRMLSRAGLSGGLTAGAAAATGRDPMVEGALGALGGGVGEAGGSLVRDVVQHRTVGRMVRNTMSDLSENFQKLLGRQIATVGPGGVQYRAAGWVGATEPEELLRQVMEGVPIADAKRQLIQFGRTLAGREIPLDRPLMQVLARIDPAAVQPGKQAGYLKLGPLWNKVPELRPVLLRYLPATEARDYARMVQQEEVGGALRRFLTGGAETSEAVGSAVKRLFDAEGRLTAEGWSELSVRISGPMAGQLERYIGPQGVQALRVALGRDVALGFARATPGKETELGAYLSAAAIPHPRVHIRAPHLPWAPGWEQRAGRGWTELAPGAVRAILGPVPTKVLGGE